MVSRLCEFAKVPRVDTTPWEGRKQSTPQKDAGILKSPVVSVPKRVSDVYKVSLHVEYKWTSKEPNIHNTKAQYASRTYPRRKERTKHKQCNKFSIYHQEGAFRTSNH